MDEDERSDLLSTASDMQLTKLLLADLHDELTERIARYRYLNDISATLGQGGTLIFGGTAAYAAIGEARSSFVHGNFVATILLCQALAENTLAGYLHVRMEELPAKVSFTETLKRCQAQGILSEGDAADLKKLAGLRNPLSHFRNVDDPDNLTRRSMSAGTPAEDLLSRDAHFAIATAIRLLASRSFRVGS
jgi:hypothetical protein